MGKYDGMTMDELEQELKKARGYGLRVVRKVAERGTEEAAESILRHARSAMKTKEVESTAFILAEMGEPGAAALLSMLRRGNNYQAGHHNAGNALIEKGGTAHIAPARRLVADLFAELDAAYRELDGWLEHLDPDSTAYVEQAFFSKFGGSRDDAQDAKLDANAPFLAAACSQRDPSVRSFAYARGDFNLAQDGRFQALRAAWGFLQAQGALDDALLAARAACRHPRVGFLED